MPVDEEALKAVAAALAEGQGEYDEGELAAAYQEIHAAMVQGAAADLVLTGQVGLRVEDGTILFTAPGSGTAESIEDYSRSHLRLVDPPSPLE